MSSDPILDNLNKAQKEAVTWPSSPLLILAGAGSGKTRILTRRIAYLVRQGVPGFNILGVTFTNKAAQEMKHRVQQMISQEVWVSTFHSTCMRILRMDGPAIQIDRNFSIYDDQDQLTIIKESIKELNLDEKQIHPKAVRERISRAKDLLMTPFQYGEKAQDMFDEAVSKVYHLYEDKLQKLKALDFGDLIMKTVLLFDRSPEVLRTWQERFQHILIDEYQDTNHAQYRFVKQLASLKRQITVVGDPDQSIYAWRGADIRNIMSFEKDYPECGIIKMEQNYRSTCVILDAANELISRNQMRKPKALWTDRAEGEKISLFEASSEREEAMYVVNKILHYLSHGKSLADQVIFYRVHAQSRVFEDMLMRSKIPYKIIGGMRFYDRMEIKDLIGYLRAVAYPHDEISLKRIINVPARGIGKKALETLEAESKRNNWSLDETLSHVQQIPDLAPKAKKSISDFYSMLTRFRKSQKDLNLRDLLEMILHETSYIKVLEDEKTTEAESRIENIQEFFSVIEEFMEVPVPQEASVAGEGNSSMRPVSQLQSFLESISLSTDLDKLESGTNVLTLMTLHTAKGLEFPIVYMVGLEEGIFPNVNSYTDDREDLEEERRLCYVGITRAKDKLHIIYARERQLYGTRQYNLPSRFLNEIPHALFDAGAGKSRFTKALEEALSDDDIEMEIDEEEIRRRILYD